MAHHKGMITNLCIVLTLSMLSYNSLDVELPIAVKLVLSRLKLDLTYSIVIFET